MDTTKPPDDPGGMNPLKEKQTMIPPVEVSYPPLPPMPEQIERPSFSAADLPISPATKNHRTLDRKASSSSLKSNATSNLRKKSSMNSIRGTQTPPMSPVSRRQSSNLPNGMVSLQSPRSSLPPAIEEPAPVVITSEEFARESFEKELHSHGQKFSQDAEVVVVLHDACYGHRFSRPKTSKSSLSTIVERPERVSAIVRGLSMAYVRLGGRHADGMYPPNPRDPVPPAPFRISKSTRSLALESPAVTRVHGVEWMKELRTMSEAAASRLAQDGRELGRMPPFDNKGDAKPALHEGDLYLCDESLNAMQGALGGVCDAIDAVFQSEYSRRAFACVRPPGHHCSSDFPSGFCWLNNVHVGIAHAIQNHGLTHAAIIDFDLHHGDGSQEITWAHNSKINCMHKNVGLAKRNPIGYFSLHDINSYPCEDGNIDKVQNASLCIENAHGQTIWNVHLQPWKTEDDFWRLYETRYLVLIEKMRDFLRTHCEKLETAKRAAQAKVTGRAQEVPPPKAAIFISAGFDASEYEGVGMQRHKVNVPTDFYARFTKDIVALSDEEGVGVDGRVISVLEGGYSDRALASGVFSHLCGLAGSQRPKMNNDLAEQMSGLSMEVNEKLSTEPGPCEAVDPSWWSTKRLDEFDSLKPMPPPPIPGPKKNRGNPTYITPTQASQAKALPPRRSLPTAMKPSPVEPAPPPRPPTPPPPDPVHWAAAASELSKLLIPDDRQIASCSAEDLAPPRQRRQRQSDIGVVRPESAASVISNGPAEGKRTGLRERKTKPIYTSDHEEEKSKKSSRPSSRANRRRTIGGPKASPKKEPAPLLMEDAPPLPSISLIPLPSSRMKSPSESSAEPHSAGPALSAPPFERALSESQVPQQSMPRSDSAHSPITPTAIEQQPENAIDVLASGMKKMSIKLNVPSKEEHDRRERERKADFQQLRGQFSR